MSSPTATLTRSSHPAGRVLVVCSPGGGFSRNSFALPGEGDSLVDTLSETCTVATVDLLGATMEAAADALAKAATALRSDGDAVAVVGLGHSLGAAVTITAQARHQPFDAVVSIGYSPTTAAKLAGDRPPDDHAGMFDRLRQIDPDLWAGDAVLFPRDLDDPAVWGDHPQDAAIEQVLADHIPVPRALAIDFCLPRMARDAAAGVSVPVLLAFGERELGVESPQHTAWFTGSGDVSVFVLGECGHIPQVSPRRADLWTHIATWIAHRTGALAEGERNR